MCYNKRITFGIHNDFEVTLKNKWIENNEYLQSKTSTETDPKFKNRRGSKNTETDTISLKNYQPVIQKRSKSKILIIG